MASSLLSGLGNTYEGIKQDDMKNDSKLLYFKILNIQMDLQAKNWWEALQQDKFHQIPLFLIKVDYMDQQTDKNRLHSIALSSTNTSHTNNPHGIGNNPITGTSMKYN